MTTFGAKSQEDLYNETRCHIPIEFFDEKSQEGMTTFWSLFGHCVKLYFSIYTAVVPVFFRGCSTVFVTVADYLSKTGAPVNI